MDLQIRYLKIPRFVAVAITLILALVLLAGVWFLITTSITQMAANIDSYQTQAKQLLKNTAQALPLEKFGLDPKDLINPTFQFLSKGIGGLAVGTFNTILNLFSKGILVLLFVMFLLIGNRPLRKRTTGVLAESQSRIKHFIITKVLISASTGILVGVTLKLLGIHLALVFGFLAFLLNFIPSLGSVIATLLPLPVVLINPDISSMTAFLAIAIPGIIQFIVGNVIDPKVLGDLLDLHPIAILMALIFWGILWGFVGMLLAAPLTAIMQIIFYKFDFTKPLAELLAGKLERLENA